ncbi:unnamed protein product [Fraxinus pennsylvanica]|uniref:FAS1 domain-containing protein n=1 Tax=Fraxinus pennsylvanica TaxID=56036 RepID=A0AAD2A4U6_9LAMI|nr:unnamed protein product [Fraxinus pennsylvanica]
MEQIFSTFLLVFFFIFFIYSNPTLSQSPAPAPGPPGPPDIIVILQKARQYTTFIRLLKNTTFIRLLKTSQVADQLNTELSKSNQGLTVFAPTDAAFTSLKPGTLNSLTDQQKVELIQFHVLPSFFSVSQFQTASNPLRTQVGNDGQFPLNVTATGNQVNITTDMVNAAVANTVYTDNLLAVYQVDKVLLPHGLFVPPPPAPAPVKPEKQAASDSSPSDDTARVDTSGAIHLSQHSIRAMSSLILVLSAFCF